MRHHTKIAIAVLVVLSACGQGAPTGDRFGGDSGWLSGLRRPDATPAASKAPRAPETPAQLTTFESCPGFLEHVQTAALRLVGPYGIEVPGAAIAVEGRAQAATTDSTAASAGAAPTYSGTNVQVEGVDEPDIVKTDGRRILAVTGQHLHRFSVSDGAAELTDSVAIDGWGAELLLTGDLAMLISTGGHNAFTGPSDSRLASDGVVVTVFDITDGLQERSRTTLEGTYVSARMVDGVARIVVRSTSNRLGFVTPDGKSIDTDEAVRRNQAVIEDSVPTDWLPSFEVRTPETTDRGQLASCSSTHHPAEFSGFGMTTVTTLDPAAPTPRDSAAVLGDTSTVYASKDNLYVATSPWSAMPNVAADDLVTQIHRFDISGTAQASYVASGEVPGSLLNQFSLDEHEGRLRVATTLGAFGTREVSESMVTILETSGRALIPVGTVGGLGLGERIYAVRFMADVGYVVTFRQVDPLYVLDLSNPREPRNVGELKIPGYSAYLHPVTDDLLLGVGQDATEEGMTTGTQVSLFDVGDPARPTRLDTVGFSDGRSDVEFDHHAFLYWAPAKLAVVPVASWSEEFAGVIGIRVGDADLEEVGRLTHPAPDGESYMGHIRRSLVIGDRLFTLSELGLGWADLGSLDELGFVGFPQQATPQPEPREPEPEPSTPAPDDPEPDPLPEL